MKINVPFFRPQIGETAISEVVQTLRCGWLTSGPQVREFEQEFARAVNGKYAVALNSCTAALHLAVEALDLREGQGVLVPTMTFAATAEIVLYKKAIPILVDCDLQTGNMDLADAERKIKAFQDGNLPCSDDQTKEVVGIIPVHVGGYMLDCGALKDFAEKHHLWIVEDAAHAFPAAWRPDAQSDWEMCGANTATVTCYSFYANKTITTGEGGMAVTDNELLAARIRLMSLHGLSHDAWGRYSGKGSWDYKIVLPGYKYNLTDIAAAIGREQLKAAENMRCQREKIACFYLEEFSDMAEIELPIWNENRINSWHLFALRLNLEKISVNRNTVMDKLKQRGIGCSVHWRPLHLHPLYEDKFGWQEHHLPNASRLWKQLISLPIFSSMTDEEMQHVTTTVRQICSTYSTKKVYMVA